MSEYESLLKRAAQQLSEIETEYNSSLHAQKIPESLLIKIKEYLGNLNSILDYVAHKQINKKFPMRNSEKDFEETYGDIGETQKKFFKKWQPYNNNTVKFLNILNNKYKHVGLVPQTRKEEHRVNVSHPTGGSVSWNPQNVTFGSGVVVMGVPINQASQLPFPNNILRTEKITWVHFEFERITDEVPTGLSALPFLKDGLQEVQDILSEFKLLI